MEQSTEDAGDTEAVNDIQDFGGAGQDKSRYLGAPNTISGTPDVFCEMDAWIMRECSPECVLEISCLVRPALR